MMKLADCVMRISVRHEDFRVSVGRPFWLVAGGSLAVSETLFIAPGETSLGMLVVFIPASVLILCAMLLQLLSLSFHVEVGPDGIASYDVWFRRRRTSWQAMTGTSLYRFFGLSYLLVRTAESRSPVWIPLFIERYELFRELMILYADATHELDRKLQESTAV